MPPTKALQSLASWDEIEDPKSREDEGTPTGGGPGFWSEPGQDSYGAAEAVCCWPPGVGSSFNPSHHSGYNDCASRSLVLTDGVPFALCPLLISLHKGVLTSHRSGEQAIRS